MHYKVVQSHLSQVSSRFNLMVLLVVSLLITNMLVGVLAWVAYFHQRREIIPFNDTKGYISSPSAVDARYLNLMALNFIYTRLNITPKTVAHNHQQLLSYVASDTYHDFLKQLTAEKKRIIEHSISSSFSLDSVQSLPSELTTIVSGTLRRWVGLRELPKERVTYQLRYRYRQGVLAINAFKKYKIDKQMKKERGE